MTTPPQLAAIVALLEKAWLCGHTERQMDFVAEAATLTTPEPDAAGFVWPAMTYRQAWAKAYAEIAAIPTREIKCDYYEAVKVRTAEILAATPQSAAPPAPVLAGEAYPTGGDREVLLYLMQQFDGESFYCPCGREEKCADMDSALYLRQYLAPHPMPASAVDGREGDALRAIPTANLLEQYADEVGGDLATIMREGGTVIRCLAALRTRTPGPAVVDEAMVERGCAAWNQAAGLAYATADRDCMRAALTAALTEQRPSGGISYLQDLEEEQRAHAALTEQRPSEQEGQS